MKIAKYEHEKALEAISLQVDHKIGKTKTVNWDTLMKIGFKALLKAIK